MKKITVSGIAIVDDKQQRFNVVIKTSDIPEKYLNGYLLNRYLPEALETEFKDPVSRIRSFEIEKIEDDKKDSVFYDKSIFELSKKELRDFCCEFLFTGIDTKKSLFELQNIVAIEYLKEIKNLDVYNIAGLSNENSKGEKIIDFDMMRKQDNKFLFTIKKSQKPNPALKSEETNKISLEYLRKQEEENDNVFITKSNKTKEKEEDELYSELKKK